MKPIIIAEDHERIRRRYARILSDRFDTNVDQVDNGEELVNKVREDDYGLVITDYEMPIRDGLDAIEAIRQFNQQVPILMISGSNIRENALESGASEYLGKPLMMGDFLSAVDRLYTGTQKN